jgi:hypothetical protein
MIQPSPNSSLEQEQRRLARAQWPVQFGPIKELEGEERNLYDCTTIEQRWAMMWQLAQDGWAMQGLSGEQRLSRTAVRLVRRGS